MYADYEFYIKEYLGELVSEDKYPKYEMQARDELDYYTRMRIPYVTNENKLERVKMCECKLIDLLFSYDQEIARIREYELKTTDNVVIASETVGKQSVSYQKATLRDVATVEKERDNKVRDIIYKTLAMTGLLYRGVCHVR